MDFACVPLASFGFSFVVVVEIESLPDRYIVLFHIGIVRHFRVQQKTVGFTSLNRLPGISTLGCSFFCHQCIYEWCLNLLVHNMHWWHCRYAGRADAGSGVYAGAHLVRTLLIVAPALWCQHVVVPATSAIFFAFLWRTRCHSSGCWLLFLQNVQKCRTFPKWKNMASLGNIVVGVGVGVSTPYLQSLVEIQHQMNQVPSSLFSFGLLPLLNHHSIFFLAFVHIRDPL